ncbi:ATP-binding protein [Konateibacter massiliensis]|uniref:ATP-binding protein n=1 Tax=Konateibacter massiliensis TaxID=2002841 RepID=UPI000C146A5B|nr:ATP-binding protein [Konateibacter massiliensis]
MALKNSQYDAIMRQYNQTQFKNKRLWDERIKEVYALHPDFENIDHSISSLSVERGKKLINGEIDAIGNLKEQIADLSKQRSKLLEHFGYPSDYLDPVYSCLDCQDTGYIGNKKCHCFQKAAIDMLYTSSNLTEVLKAENFEHYTDHYYSEAFTDTATGLTALSAAKRAYTEAKDFVGTFDTDFRNLLLYGDTGVGKTFLTNCIAKELMDSSHSVIYFSAFQLFDALAKSTFGTGEEYDDAVEYIFDCDLLIIDDLGTELTNSFVSSQLFLCVNERLLRRRSTIISTNLPLNRLLDTYSERTFSRISSNYTMIKLIGEDIRLKKKRG